MSTNPQAEEAKNAKTADVEFRGHTFTVSREYGDWTVDFVEALEEGKAVGIVRGALGADQWRVVRSMDLRMRELDELADAVAKAMGFGSTGESAASSS